MGAYLELIRQQKQTQQQETELRTNMMSAAETDPDSLARAKKSADMLGLPLQAVQERLPEVEKQAFVEGFGYQDLIKQAPRTAEWLAADPLHAGVAKDDIENLSLLESVMARVEAGGRSLAAGPLRLNASLWGIPRAGADLVSTLLTGPLANVGVLPEDVGAKASQFFQQKQASAEYATNTVRGDMSKFGPREQALYGGIESAGQTLVALPAAVVTGNPSVLLGTLSASTGGEAYGKARDQGIGPAQALNYAASQAAIEYATEKLPVGTLFRDLGLKRSFARVLTNQLITEMPQEQIATVLQDLNDWATLNPERPFSEYIAARPEAAIQTAIATAVGTGLQTSVASAVDTAVNGPRHKQAEQVFKAVADTAKNSKLRERLPEKFKELAERYAGAQNAFIDATMFNRYFQSVGIDPAAVAAELGVKNYSEAVSAGTDIVIPMGSFAAQLAPTDHLQGLMPDLKLSQGELSAREYEAQQATEGEQEQEIAGQAETETPDASRQQIFDDVLGQLVGRYERSTAEAYATQYTAGISTMAERMGMDPLELHQRYGLTITSPLPDVLTKRPDLDTVIDPMIDAIRAGTLPTDTEVNGPSLTEFLRERGGVRDEGGELASRDAKQQVRGLVRDNGLSLDAAREAAAEAGYIGEDSTVSDFIDLLDNELRGDAVYSMRNRNDSLAEQQNALRELSNWMDQQGIDLNTMDNAAVKRLINPEREGREFEQISPEQAMSLNYETKMPDDLVFAEAVANTPGAEITDDGLLIDLVRFQKVEQEGAQAIRTGVFYLPVGSPNTKHYRTTPTTKAPNAYGGTEKLEGQTLIRRPLFVKGATGGKAPEAAFDVIKGKGAMKALDKAVMDVVTSRGWMNKMADDLFEERVQQFLSDNGGDPGLAWEIIQNSKAGNTLRYALQEHVIAHAVRDAGYDSVVGYSKGKAGTFISEVFDVREQTYPARGMDSQVHDKFFQSAAAGDVTQTPEFKAWFGDSKVVDAEGKPLVVYHGTASTDIESFMPHDRDGNQSQAVVDFYRKAKENNDRFGYMNFRSGTFFSPHPEYAGNYTAENTGVMYPVYIKAENPIYFDQRTGKVTGVDPNKTPDALIMMDGDTINEVAVIDPAQIKSAIGNRGTFDPSNPNILEQRQQDGARGYIRIGDNQRMSIALLERANLSTFLHEVGHMYLEVLGDLASSESAPQQIQDDYKTLLDWFGVESRDQIQVEHHEQFARANEAYLMEGKAPSAALRAVFQRFKAWLTMIYRNISRLDVQLTPEVRAVFDRIYASDEEIEAARAESGMQALFSSAEQMGLTDAEFAAYRNTVTDASVQAQDKLRVELMNEYQREQTKWWNEERDKIRQQVTAEVNAQPVYVAFDALVSGTQGKLSKDDLIRRYGEAYLKRFKRGYGEGKGAVYATDGGGMDIDLAAEIFGYQSGDALVQDLVNIRPRKQLIDAETDARMREQYGDTMLDGTIAERAEYALHNDKRADILMTELRALRRKEREVAPFVQAERSKQRDRQRTMRAAADGVPPVEYFRNAARGLVSQQAVNELQPHRYLLAERKASRRAFEAMAKGEPTVAANEKQRELLNHFLYLESTAAQERADKIAAYAEGLTKRTTQERIGKAGEEYLDALNEILDAYQFRRTTNKQLQLIAKVRAAVAAADAEGEIIDVMMDEQGNVIDPALLNVRNYRELTIDELEAVRDMLKNIEHVAREKNKFRTAEVQAEFDEIAGKVLDEIADGKPAKPVDVYKLRDPRHQKWRAIPLAIAEWRGLFSYVQEAVGFKQNSTLWNYVMRPLNDAAAREAVMKREAAKQLDALFERYSTTYLYGKGKVIPGVGSVNKQQQLMLAASWGTETGRQRMLDNGFDGRGLSDEQVNSVLDSLDERDWGFVQDLWKLFDSYWKPVADKQQRVTGVRPDQVDALPFMTQFGEMPGGYSPIAYESFLDNRAAAQQAAQIADEMKRAAYTRNTTRRGFLKQRVERIQGKAVRYDFGVTYKHLNEVIHDVTHHETLRDVQKLLNHKLDGRSILDEITQRMGYGVRDQIVETLEEIAVGDLRVMGNSERIMEHLAAGASIAGMAYNVWNAVQNITGIANSIAVIGPSAVMRGAWEWIGTPQHMLGSIDTVQEKSEFMRTRYLNMNRDINAMRGRLEQASGRPAVDSAYAAYREGGFWMMIRMQQLVDMPTWIGAYDQAKRDFPDITEANAVALADQAVLAAQGGGRTVDLSKFMRGKGWARVWTVFAGYFNVVYQRTAESMLRAGVEGYTPQAVGRMVTDMFFLMIAPAAMTVILKQAIDAMVGGDDDDAEEWMTKYFKEQVSYILAMFPFIRETSAAVAGYASYSGPVGARFFADVNKFIRQVAQGEVDENLVKAGVRVAGTPFGIPTSQIIKTYDGMEEMMAGNATPLALLFGPPKKD